MKPPFTVKTAFQKVAGQLSEKLSPAMQSNAGGGIPAAHIIKHFSFVIDILEKENAYLRENDPLKAIDLFPKKKTLTTALHDIINEGKTKGVRSDTVLTAQLKETEMRFRKAAQENQDLLRQAITTQDAVMKILIESAIENNRHAYNRAGTIESDTSRAAFSLNDSI